MNPRLRNALIVIFGAGVGVAAALGVAEEHYGLAALAAVTIFWLAAEWLQGPLPDAWMLAAVLAGYIVGNRGFAQLQPVERLPLLPAEAVLLFAAPALGVRIVFKQATAFRRDWLNGALLLWVLLGTARLPLDFSRHGFIAARDFAMVYYAAFFFIGQAMAAHSSSRALLQRTLTGAFAAVPVVAALFRFVPDFFLSVLTFRGVPLIYYKNDLLATLLGAGFFWLWSRWEKTRHPVFVVAAAACLVEIGTTASPRAAMVALAGVTAMWLLARRWHIARAQLAIVAVAGLAAVFILSLDNRNLRETSIYSTYEHALSIFDFQGKGNYFNRESGDPGDNNRFRLVWWRAVAGETLEENPAFGLGFGHDLANRFLADYDMLGVEDFSARSPHSMIMSVFGRLGLVGLACWLWIAAGMASLTRRVFRAGDLEAIGLISVAWVIWLSACFGVVLEGPMGAVVFWTLLGLANATPAEPETAAPIAEALPSAEASASPAGSLS